MRLTHKNQAAPWVLSQWRQQPGLKQALVELGCAHQPKTAHHKVIGRQRQLLPCLLPVALLRQCARQRHHLPESGKLAAVPCLGQLPRMFRMNNHPQRLLHNAQIGGVLGNHSRPAFFGGPYTESRIAMRLVQGAEQAMWHHAVHRQIIVDIAQKKIVQDHHARHPRQQLKHMLVVAGVAKVVHHPVIALGMVKQPLHIAHATVGTHPRRGKLRLIDDHVNIVKVCQCWQQLCAVVGDAAALRR